MNMYLNYFEGIDFNSNVHVKDIKNLFVNGDRCVALYINGEFNSYYDIPDFYNLIGDDFFKDYFNDFCLGIYINDFGSVNFIVNFEGVDFCFE